MCIRDSHSTADSSGEVPKAEEQSDSNVPTVFISESDNAESRKSGSEMSGSTSPGSHHSESDVEVVTIWKTTCIKKTPKNTSSTRDATANAPGASESNPNVDKVSESELWEQWHQDAQLLDKDWHLA